MKQFFKNIYLNSRFFISVGVLVFLFILAFIFSGLLVIAQMLFFVFLSLVIVDYILLFKQKGVSASRILPEKLSNGDDNPIEISLQNNYNFISSIKIIDELPFQYQ